jgi:hypothetical protein
VHGAASSDVGTRVLDLDAATWADPCCLIPSAPEVQPDPDKDLVVPRLAQMARARVNLSLTGSREIYLSFAVGNISTEMPLVVFKAAAARAAGIAGRAQVATPDPFFNAGIPTATAAVDGLWREASQTFVHGAVAVRPVAACGSRATVLTYCVWLKWHRCTPGWLAERVRWDIWS